MNVILILMYRENSIRGVPGRVIFHDCVFYRSKCAKFYKRRKKGENSLSATVTPCKQGGFINYPMSGFMMKPS